MATNLSNTIIQECPTLSAVLSEKEKIVRRMPSIELITLANRGDPFAIKELKERKFLQEKFLK